MSALVLHFGAQVKCLLAAAGKGLILSVATPGQGGPQQRTLLDLRRIFSCIPTGLGHVNEQPHEYVIKLLEDNCLVMLPHASHRNVLKHHMPTWSARIHPRCIVPGARPCTGWKVTSKATTVLPAALVPWEPVSISEQKASQVSQKWGIYAISELDRPTCFASAKACVPKTRTLFQTMTAKEMPIAGQCSCDCLSN